MDMEKTVRFSGWTPNPKSVNIGMERDNKVFTLRFEGLPEYPGGTTYLHIDLGGKAESIALENGCAVIGRTVTQFEGEHEAYLETLAQGDVVWHSDVLMVVVGRLPLVGEKVEQAYPTAFEQVLLQTAQSAKDAAASAQAAADTAAGIVVDEQARQAAETTREQQEAARESAEADRQTAEKARQQAETSRQQAETAREAAEQGRTTAESNRETAEAAREEAEAKREETVRLLVGGETARQESELERVAAERGRVTAENARVVAENARATAEGEREKAAQEAVAGLDAVREEWKEKLDSGALRGEKGDKGEKGEDANVTEENIVSALGYAPVVDVQIGGGTTKNSNNVAVLPNVLSLDDAGVLRVATAPEKTKWTNAVGIDTTGRIILATSSKSLIDTRSSNNIQVLTLGMLDYLVKAAMSDGRGAAWSESEKEDARTRMSAAAEHNWVKIETIKLTEATMKVVRTTEPDGTAYDLIGLKIRIKFPVGQRSGGIDLRTITAKAPNGDVELRLLSNVVANTAAAGSGYVSTNVLAFVPLDGMYFNYSAYGGQGQSMHMQMGSNGIGLFEYTTKHILGFNFFIYDNVTILAGTTIEIYGVRA